MRKGSVHVCVVAIFLLAIFMASEAMGVAHNHQCTYSQPLWPIAPKIEESVLTPFAVADLTPLEGYALRLYARLTGSTIAVKHPRFRRLVRLLGEQKYMEAARLITEERSFLAVRVRNFVAPFSSKEYSPLEPFNDLQALMMGVIRDELDARLILTGDFRYQARTEILLPPVTMDNNEHYRIFEESLRDPQDDLIRVEDQWPDLAYGAGVFTTRAWAKLAYEAGTNRRAVKYAFETFLCAPIDSWKMRGVPDHFVRRDVDRAPGGNPATYQNTCRSCHALMDAMGGAFARYEFVDGAFMPLSDGVASKMNQNAQTYPAGYVTTDSSWLNMLPRNHSLDFGWRTALAGQGVQDFAHMIAGAFAYSECLTHKVYQELCGAPTPAQRPRLQELAHEFEAQNYNLKWLFARVATLNECIAH